MNTLHRGGEAYQSVVAASTLNRAATVGSISGTQMHTIIYDRCHCIYIHLTRYHCDSVCALNSSKSDVTAMDASVILE